MRELDFSANGVQGTVREEIGRDMFNARGIYARLWQIEEELDVYDTVLVAFAQCLNQTINIEGLPSTLPKPTAPAQELYDAFVAWQELPPAIVRAWNDAIVSINTPPGDEDLQPDISQKKDKTPES